MIYKALQFFFISAIFFINSFFVLAEDKTNSKAIANKEKKIQIKSLEALLKEIKKDQVESRPELKKREARFLKARNQQKALLKSALSELNKEENILKSLQSEFEKQDEELSQLEEKLALTMGALGELFGVVKQSAGETKALFENSIVSAEYENRSDFMKKISAKKNLPNISDLEMLWFLIQQEMTESGKVSRFKQEVIKANGKTETQDIIRIGSFNLISQGKYLNYDSETQKVIELVRQPDRRFLSLAKKLQKAKKDIYAFGIDPSRGSLLSLLIQTPNFFERISQGGIIGYFILFLLLFGLFLSIKKYLKLQSQEQLLNNQINSKEILKNNPLGEIIQIFTKYKEDSQDSLELKMEEAIVQKTSLLKKGLSTIKLLASIAPLLGLLGTVTGMIATFQSITLFGTGDPKLMAGGISQALVTTALGLVVAIPLVFIHNFLSSKANTLIKVYEEQSLGLLSRMYK
ncbi:MAG: MotA/TolQ/ExbB proton channel family protein [Bdellovibrionaceae bacterium]|nr:MotA/TolQ/ExbB proton channel family protein [Pseudobdellovibrionaceae bacterium]